MLKCVYILSSGFVVCGFHILVLVVEFDQHVYNLTDCEEDEFLHHRTCWKHIAAALNKCGSKPKRAKELEMFKLSAPCFYDECTRRGRSERRIKCKYLASKLRKKLNSKAFVGYLE